MADESIQMRYVKEFDISTDALPRRDLDLQQVDDASFAKAEVITLRGLVTRLQLRLEALEAGVTRMATYQGVLHELKGK